jgi:hypothetical protein
VVVLAAGDVWGEIRVGYVYIRVRYTHLGCFGARGEAGGGTMEFATCSRSPGLPIRQAVPVGLGLGITPGLIGLGFSWKKLCIVVNTV